MAAKKTSKTVAKSAKAAPLVTDRARKVCVVAFAFSGMAALMYEVLWSRELSLVFGSTVYAVSMMLAAFMSGLSLGAWLGGKWADRSPDPVTLFARLEFGIGVFGLLTLPLVRILPDVYFSVFDALRPPFWAFFLIQMALSYLVMLAPTTLMGATFPVVSKINTDALAEVGQDVGTVYSVNTLGSIAGSLGTGFLLIPLIGVQATTLIAALLNVCVAVVVWSAGQRLGGVRALVLGGASLAVAATLALVAAPPAFAHNFYRIGDFDSLDQYHAFQRSIETVFDRDDVHGRVVVFRTADGEMHLQNSGKVEGSTGELDRQTTRMLAAVPAASAEQSRSALVVGLGTGFTTRAALDLGFERVDTVEINDAVLDASRLFLGGELDDPRQQTHVADARHYLELESQRRWDVITSEPSYPLSTHVSHLFTREFYQLARSRLEPGGAFCQWIPRYLLRDEDTLMMLKTFSEVFPNTYVWGSSQGENEAVDLLLIGVNGDSPLDIAAVEEAARAMMGDTQDFSLFADVQGVAGAVAGPGIDRNTDDRPLLEFRAPRNQVEFFQRGAEGLRGGR